MNLVNILQHTGKGDFEGYDFPVSVNVKLQMYSVSRYAATNVIKHKTNSGPVNTWKTFATKPAIGTTETWTSAVTVDSGRRFALRVDTNGGKRFFQNSL